MIRRKFVFKSILCCSLLASTAAFADSSTTTGIQQLTSAISFTDVITAIFAVGVLVIGVDLAQLGYMKVRRLLKGAH